MTRGTRALLPRGPLPPPGVRLPPGAAREVRAALRRHAHGEAVILFSEGVGLEVVDRATLVARYRRAGCRELVMRLRGAVVPRGYVLGLVDAERGTRVICLALETLLAGADLPLEGDDAAPIVCGTYRGAR